MYTRKMLMSPLVSIVARMCWLAFYLKRFLLRDFRLSIINAILIYGLITTQFEIAAAQANGFDKSTTMLLRKISKNGKPSTFNMLATNATTTTIKATTITTTEKPLPTSCETRNSTSISIKTFNRKLSGIFMSDDVAKSKSYTKTDNASSPASVSIPSNAAIVNVDVNNFQIGTTATTPATTVYKEHEISNGLLLQQTLLPPNAVVKRQRWIRDLFSTTAKQTTESMSSAATTITTTTTNDTTIIANTAAAAISTIMTTTKPPTTTTNGTKKMPKAVSLPSIAQNSSFIIRENSAPTESPATNINNSISYSLQLPQKQQQQQPKLWQKSKEIRILSRRKRFLTFPEGSSFSVAVCITVGIIGNPSFNYMAYGLNWGVAYDLPNATWVINHLHGFSRHPVPATVMRRRARRALYTEIEALVENMGYNGRSCVLRALCENKQYFRKNKLSMVGEMLRVIFSLPKQRLFTRELRENSGIELYDHAYRHTRDVDCSAEYDCPFSLLELAFGKYSHPPPGYYD